MDYWIGLDLEKGIFLTMRVMRNVTSWIVCDHLKTLLETTR